MNGAKYLNRRFSLDSLGYSPDIGVLGKTKGSKMRRCSEGMKGRGLDEAHLELLDINRPLSRNSSTQTTTIEEEGIERLDGQIRRNSFKNHSKTFHKHFPEISGMEELARGFTCAFQKEVLYHGKMYVSNHHVCFHSSVLLKETKVVIHAPTILAIKKKNTARVVPNAISIITNSGEKYLFVSLLNRDGCFQLIGSICPHLKSTSANGSPLMFSPENGHELEADTISSHSSQDDSVDHGRISLPEQDKSLGGAFSISGISNGQVKNSSTPRSSSSSSSSSSSKESHSAEDTVAGSWVTMVTQKIRSSLSMTRTTNINKLFVVYLILALLLLLSSGYIGLRIVALEEQLNLLGAMPEFSTQREFKEM